MYLLGLNSLCLHSLACIKRFSPISYPFWQTCFPSRESPIRGPDRMLKLGHLPLLQTILSVIYLATAPTSLALARLQVHGTLAVPLCFFLMLCLSFPCIFCRYYLVLFHCFYPHTIKVFPHLLHNCGMGFLSLPYYIMLGWTYWLLGSSPFFFIGFCWTTIVGPYLTLSLLGFSRPILLFEKGHSTPMHCPSLKEGPWAHFGLCFLFSTSILSFFAIAWATFVFFLTF